MSVNMKERSFKAALGGIIAALSIAVMFSTGIIPFLTYAMPAICGALLMLIVIEIGSGFALTVYVAVAILSLLVVADKEAAVMYAAFFGYYPIIKRVFEKYFNRTVCRIFKFLLFNVAMIAAYFVVSKVLGISDDDGLDFLGKYVLWVLLALGNIFFVLYDIALTRLVTLYLLKWQKTVKRIFKH